jgi:hypothetical protein
MLNFHQLINHLSKEQRVFSFPYKTEPPQTNLQVLEGLFEMIGYSDEKGEFELMPSFKKEESILISTVNLLFQYPAHQLDQYLDQLKNYLVHWMIVYRDVMKDYQLNSSKINFYLNSQLDHEDQLLLLALVFRVNIVVVNLDRQFRLYSPISLGNVFLIFYQHTNLKYSGVKFRPRNKKALANITGFMSIVEPDHPLIPLLLANLA